MNICSVLHLFEIRFLHVFLVVNSQTVTILGVVLFILLLLSFTISGAEVALFSLSGKDINLLKTKQHSAARRIVTLLEEPKEVYASLLIAGTFTNISIIVIANYLLASFIDFGVINPWIILIIKVSIIALILIFFARILPKVWATQNNLRFAYSASSIIEGLHLLLRRISKWLVSLADKIGKTTGADKTTGMSIREMDEAIDIHSNDDITQQEKNIMKGVVKFGNISVRQIMQSRTLVKGIADNSTFEEVLNKVQELHFSRFPIYKENLDNVVGMLNTKDLIPHLTEANNFEWHTLLRPSYFVPETKLIEDLLKDFQLKRIHFAVVVDEFGGTSGIVTMEDIMEEVIGDIHDEFDEVETDSYKLDEQNYIFEGKSMIHDVCRIMKIPADTFNAVKGESESLAGLVLEVAGEFPAQDWVIPWGNYEFTIMEMTNNRIQLVKVTTVPSTKN